MNKKVCILCIVCVILIVILIIINRKKSLKIHTENPYETLNTFRDTQNTQNTISIKKDNLFLSVEAGSFGDLSFQKEPQLITKNLDTQGETYLSIGNLVLIRNDTSSPQDRRNLPATPFNKNIHTPFKWYLNYLNDNIEEYTENIILKSGKNGVYIADLNQNLFWPALSKDKYGSITGTDKEDQAGGLYLDIPQLEITAIISTIKTVILDKATEELNIFLKTPIQTKTCLLDFSNINPDKCFGLSAGGNVSTGVPAIDTAFKVACQAECNTEPWTVAKWICCKLPIFDCGDCPSTICNKRCNKGLISWKASIDNIYGIDEINITDVLFSKIDNNTLTLEVKFAFPKDITIKGNAHIGGLLSAVPALAHIPTSIDISGKINNPRFSVFLNVETFCSNDKIGIRKITTDSLYMNKGDLTLSIDDGSFIKWGSVLSVVTNKVVLLFKDIIRSSINEKIIPQIGDKLSKAIANVTKNIIEIDFLC